MLSTKTSQYIRDKKQTGRKQDEIAQT